VELGRTQDGQLRLTPHELASRLSFFFWDTMPDDGLFAAADSGTLDTPVGVEAQARRLLGDARARAAVAHFQGQWLGLAAIFGTRKDPAVLAGWDGPLTETLRQATARFVEHAFWELGGLGALFTTPKAFVDARTAPLYGLTAQGAELRLVELPTSQRAGLLTQAGLMAALGSETTSAPVRRGVFVLDRVLCAPPPPPPPNALSQPAPPGPKPVTTRERFEKQHTGPTCLGCHDAIDGIGFAFEHYDAVGRWRDTENGAPVNAQGQLAGLGDDVDGPVDGALELSKKLAVSSTVRDCVAAHWLAYALGSAHDSIDACTLQPIVRRWQEAHLDMRELLVALVTSDAFRNRPTFAP
jgi:hypothetical protein